MSNFPAPAVSWSDVARVCRRVCVLRERGQGEEAERVRVSELMPLVTAARTTESDIAITERLDALFAAETERVANATVLAELLLPRIAEHLRLPATPQALPGTAQAYVDESPPPAKPTAPRATTVSIADFIDEMIAQEKPPDRPGAGAQRRAS